MSAAGTSTSDGETLLGCDYFSKPWRSRGACAGACYTPTHDLEALAAYHSFLKGCVCNADTDQTQCILINDAYHPIACVGGTWSFDFGATCVPFDAGTPLDAGIDAPTGVDAGASVD